MWYRSVILKLNIEKAINLQILWTINIAIILFMQTTVYTQPTLDLSKAIVSETNLNDDAFPLVVDKHASFLWFDTEHYKGVNRTIGGLQSDIEHVTNYKPKISSDITEAMYPVIIGNVCNSKLVDDLISSGKLDGADLLVKWESFVINTITDPTPGD